MACNETQQIDHIHANWQRALQAQLPGGAGKVTWDSAHLVYTITVMWHQRKHGVSSTNCNGAATDDLACFVIQIKL